MTISGKMVVTNGVGRVSEERGARFATLPTIEIHGLSFVENRILHLSPEMGQEMGSA